MEACGHARVSERFAVPEASAKHLLDALGLVEIGECFSHGGVRHVGSNAHHLQPPENPERPAAADVRLGPCVRACRPGIVERTFGSQAADRRLHVVGLEMTAGETRTQLGLRELPSRQELQAHHIGALTVRGHLMSLRETGPPTHTRSL